MELLGELPKIICIKGLMLNLEQSRYSINIKLYFVYFLICVYQTKNKFYKYVHVSSKFSCLGDCFGSHETSMLVESRGINYLTSQAEHKRDLIIQPLSQLLLSCAYVN